jgi:hypothetical protein
MTTDTYSSTKTEVEELRDLRAELKQAAQNLARLESEIERIGSGKAPIVSPATGCSIKFLPQEKLVAAARKAIEINPSNAPVKQLRLLGAPAYSVPKPEQLAVLAEKYWGQDKGVHLTVGFLDNPEPALRTRILSHMNAWAAFANVEFVETASSPQVRITRIPGNGHWSYLGTDILMIDPNQPTMNLDNFTMNMPESEFIRVVRHETGHTMGFPHEHTRQEIVNGIDEQKAIEYFGRTQGWSPEEVRQQVLTPLSDSAIYTMGPADPNSIMCYWLPAEIMKNGIAVSGGPDIDVQDTLAATWLYPKTFAAPLRTPMKMA